MKCYRDRRAELKLHVAEREILIAPGAFDALGACLIEQAGFRTVYLTGSGVAYSHGLPDVGLISPEEMVRRAQQINDKITIPMIADADTGFGGILNLRKIVRDYEHAGVAAIQIEDQTFPKKCGHYLGREVISADEMILKIQAIEAARSDPNFLIIARTDARTVYGLEEAIRRGKLYAKAGAEVIFVESPETKEEMARIAQEIPAFALANMVEGGRTPLLSARELEQLGFAIAIFPNAYTRTITFAAMDMLKELRATGTTRNRLDRMLSFKQLNDLVNAPESFDWEARDSPESHVKGGIES